jgi:hypothetical protein
MSSGTRFEGGEAAAVETAAERLFDFGKVLGQ